MGEFDSKVGEFSAYLGEFVRQCQVTKILNPQCLSHDLGLKGIVFCILRFPYNYNYGRICAGYRPLFA